MHLKLLEDYFFIYSTLFPQLLYAIHSKLAQSKTPFYTQFGAIFYSVDVDNPPPPPPNPTTKIKLIKHTKSQNFYYFFKHTTDSFSPVVVPPLADRALPQRT